MKKVMLGLFLVSSTVSVQTTKPLLCEALVAIVLYKCFVAPSNRLFMTCECYKYKNIVEDLKRRMSQSESRQAETDGRFARLLKDLREKNPDYNYMWQ